MNSNYYYNYNTGAWMLKSAAHAEMVKTAGYNVQLYKQAGVGSKIKDAANWLTSRARGLNNDLIMGISGNKYLAAHPILGHAAYAGTLGGVGALGGAGLGALGGLALGDTGLGAGIGTGLGGALGLGAWGMGRFAPQTGIGETFQLPLEFARKLSALPSALV